MKKVRGLMEIFLLTVVFALMAGCGNKETAGQNDAGGAKAQTKEEKVVNIGIQQSIWPILIAKEKGWFEEEFAKAGAKVNWVEFQSGPAYFEAIVSDRLDFGRVGNIPVLAGQAANVPFKEIANGSNGEKGDAILVRKDSPIRTLQDLKGKKIAVAKGSSAYGLLYKALAKANIDPADVKIIQLQPDEAQPAFETSSVDAWAIWEPFQSTQVIKNGAKVIANGETIQSSSPGFQIVRTKFAEENPDLVVRYLKVTEKATRWQKEHPEEAVKLYAKLKKVDENIIRQVIKNSEAANLPITDEVIKNQQETADLLYDLGGLKKKVDTKEVVDNSYIEKALKEYNTENK
jgi:sulfonate transport system substrate-binding protein